jgi:hypothetical protein
MHRVEVLPSHMLSIFWLYFDIPTPWIQYVNVRPKICRITHQRRSFLFYVMYTLEKASKASHLALARRCWFASSMQMLAGT